MKILNPKRTSRLAKLVDASLHGRKPLTNEQVHGKMRMTVDNFGGAASQTKSVYAAYEDPMRPAVLPLTKAVEVWGLDPFSESENSSSNSSNSSSSSSGNSPNRNNSGRRNVSDRTVNVGGSSIALPLVAPKYLKWLQMRQSVCREMRNMSSVGDHINIVELYGVLELIQDSKSTLFLVIELVSGGELFERTMTMPSSIDPTTSRASTSPSCCLASPTATAGVVQ